MRKIFACVCAIALSICFLPSCAQNKEARGEFFAFDTFITVTAWGEDSEAAIAAVRETVERKERIFSVNGSGEEGISKLNAERSAVFYGSDARFILRCIELCRETDGAFNPALYPVSVLWGFTSGDPHVPESSALKRALPLCDPEAISVRYENDALSVELEEGMLLDLGAAAKGYISDMIREALAKLDIGGAVINLGGNVVTVGQKNGGQLFYIGIADPDEPSSLLCALRTGENCVVTSGAYQRNFTENGVLYHHILDPVTGMPAANGVISVTVISEDGTLADALSTAFYVNGVSFAEEYFRAHGGFEFLLLTDAGELYVTPGLCGKNAPEILKDGCRLIELK